MRRNPSRPENPTRLGTPALPGLGIRVLFAACLLCLAAGPGLARAEAQTARTVVEATVADVLSVLREAELPVPERRSKIEEIAYARFDFQTMGKLVLARNWKKFDDTQRVDFIVEFKRHLSRSYGERIERYEQEQVEITGEREEQRGDVTVLTAIRGGQFDGSEVHYRMRDRDGAWRVIDVIIENVSLVGNFRSQFKDIVGRNGPDGLIAQLRAKNDASLVQSGG